MTKVKHLQSLCVIQVDFDIWSGQTRLSASDLKLGEGGEIPPEKVAQLGNKKICDPAKLKGFHRLKTETRRLLMKFGMPFMNGFAVPITKTDEISNKLNNIRFQFNQMKHNFINGYNKMLDEWCHENPEYERAIRAGAIPKETVEERIGFEYELFMIQPLSEDEASAKRLNRKVECLGEDLISEVVKEANKFYMERLAGRDRCAVQTKQTLLNIRNKVDGLSFLNSAFNPLVTLLDQTLRGYEQHSDGCHIVAPFFYQVVAAVLIMSKREHIEQYANGSITVEGMAHKVGGSETQMEDGPKNEKADNFLSMSGGNLAQKQAKATDFFHKEKIDSIFDAVELDEDIDNFFKNFDQLSEGGSDDDANASEGVQEENNIKDAVVFSRETETESKHLKESLLSKEPLKTKDDGDYFF